jgi:hypothetical protein
LNKKVILELPKRFNDDEWGKTGKNFPIQDELKAANDAASLFVDSRKIPWANQTPLHLIVISNAGRIRSSQFFCPHWLQVENELFLFSIIKYHRHGADTIDSPDFVQVKVRLLKAT